jgi:hypothetical protein
LRGDPEDIIFLESRTLFDIAVSKGLVVGNLAVADNECHGPRYPLILYLLLQEPVDL